MPSLTPSLQWTREPLALQGHSIPLPIYLHWQWFRPWKGNHFSTSEGQMIKADRDLQKAAVC